METIKHFLISLAKEGLVEGHVTHRNKRYVFRQEKGLTRVDIQEVDKAAGKDHPTEKREPLVREEPEPAVILSATGQTPRKSRPYKYIAFFMIFVAAVVLVVIGLPHLGKGSREGRQEDALWQNALQQETTEAYRAYIRDFPQGRYSQEAVSRIGKLERKAESENRVQELLARSEKYLADGELENAVQTLDQARTIRSGEDIDALDRKIQDQIAVRSNAERYRLYIEMGRKALAGNDLEKAAGHLTAARSAGQGPEADDLERSIREKTEYRENREKQARLISLADQALAANESEKATAYLTQAKSIESNAETDALAERISIWQSEEKKKLEQKKVDDVYNRYLGFARDYFDEGNFDRALENIQKARKIKDTEELNRFENQVREKQSETAAGAEAKKRSEQYRRFMDSARNDFDRGNYESALDSVQKARGINDTSEAETLEMDIRRVRDGLEKEKQRIEEEKKKKQSDVAVKSVKIIDLPPQLINTYNEKLKVFEIIKLIRGIRVIGQINLSLNVQENGRVSVQKLSDSGLEVNPPGSRNAVIRRIFARMNSFRLPAPIDRGGYPVRVENWRLTYSVGTFANRVIFRRKF